MSNLLNNILFFFYSRCSHRIDIVVNKRLCSGCVQIQIEI